MIRLAFLWSLAMRRLFWIVLGVALLPLPATADSKAALGAIDAKLTKCIAADESNMGMQQCTNTAYQAADKVLNSTYQAMSKNWVGTDADAQERKKRLVNAQRTWVAFRDAEFKQRSA
eukprot:gene9551-9627_t